jgi:hypothetical protein
MSLPYQIEAIKQQLGGGLNSALAYTGAHQLTYFCKYEFGGGNSKVLDNGLVEAPVALTFRVNGKHGAGWRIIINIEPSDTYSVRLWQAAKLGAKTVSKLMAQNKPIMLGEVLAEVKDVYCDNLRQVVERMYDDAIKKHCGGFAPLG